MDSGLSVALWLLGYLGLPGCTPVAALVVMGPATTQERREVSNHDKQLAEAAPELAGAAPELAGAAPELAGSGHQRGGKWALGWGDVTAGAAPGLVGRSGSGH